MLIKYNFAFTNSKLKEWFKPAPPNLLFSDVSFNKKIRYLTKALQNNRILFYPSSVVILFSILLQLINIYPKQIIKSLEDDHKEFTSINSKISNLNSSKSRFRNNLNNIQDYFYKPTYSYLFAFYLQNAIPKGVKLNSYSFNDNGFDIDASSYNVESLNELITLIIESPVVKRDTVNIENLSRELNQSTNSKDKPNFNLKLYGNIMKIDISQREVLYVESNAFGLLKKLQRFNQLKNLLKN